MRRNALWLGVAVFVFSTTAGAARVQLIPALPDSSLNINMQMQGWFQALENAAPNGTGWDYRVFLRRTRLILSGDFTKQLHFFVNIDAPNWGRANAGDPTGLNQVNQRFLIQDVRMVYEPVPGIFVVGGFLIIPISRHMHQSTLSFNTIDQHTATLRFQQTGTGNSNLAFREPGVEAHGWLFDKRVGFRFGLYNGVRGTTGAYDPVTNPLGGVNPDAVPRIAGYLHLNLLDSEERGFLYQGVYFAEKPILSVGVGTNYQAKSVRVPATGQLSDYRGTAADVFLEYPFGNDTAVNFQFAFYNYDFGDGHPSTGNGFFSDLGYRYGQWQPVVSYEYFHGTSTLTAPTLPDDARIWTAGINWWINKTTANLKWEFQHVRRGLLSSPSGTVLATNQNQKIITLAGQLFF